MGDPWAAVAGRVAAVRAEVAAAAVRAGRDPSHVVIVAVGKTFPAAALDAALAAGLADVGENYVQEARAKRPDLRHPARWHLIGGLQRNKVRAAVAVFDCIHTVDSAALGAMLAQEAVRASRTLPVLIQVKSGGEATKRGVLPEEVVGLAAMLLGRPGIALQGLMTVPPPGDTRPYLRALREVRDGAATRLGVELPHLSMGMSDDFAAAVEEGATLLRLGRALFGPRVPGARPPGS